MCLLVTQLYYTEALSYDSTSPDYPASMILKPPLIINHSIYYILCFMAAT